MKLLRLLVPILLLLWTLPAQATVNRDCDYTNGSTTTNQGFTNCDEEFVSVYARAFVFPTTTGTDTYAGTSSPAVTSLTNGLPIIFTAPNTNTGASTYNLDSTGAVSIVLQDGSTALSAGDLVSGTRYMLTYRSSTPVWILQGSPGAGGGVPSGLPYVLVSNSGAVANERALAAGTALGLTDGGANSSLTIALTDVELTSIAGLTSAADKFPYYTGSGTAALANLSSGFRTFLTTSSVANLASVLTDEAAGWATFQATPSMANLGSFLTDDASGWTTFGTTPSSANLAALLNDEAAGLATMLVTPSSSNIASWVTNETGSGSLVFGTSPGFTTAANPISNDGAALGETATPLRWADLFLADGGVINIGTTSSKATITHDAATDSITIAADPDNATATSVINLQVDGGTEATLNTTNFSPGANDGNALGVSGTAWADLFLASGGLIEMDGGTTNTLTCTGGNCTIEGNGFYRAGGTDVALADGGTGASLADPNADKWIFWDDSAGAVDFLTMGTAYVTSGTTLRSPTESLCVAASDETTAITTGTAKVTFRMPYAFTLTAIRASLTTVATGASLLTVDVNEAGTTIISTKLTFDASESTTVTAATPPVISDSSLADDGQMTVDIDQIGNTTPGKGLKVCLIGYQT